MYGFNTFEHRKGELRFVVVQLAVWNVLLIHCAAGGGVCRECVCVCASSPKLYDFKHFISKGMIFVNTTVDTVIVNAVSKKRSWSSVDAKLILVQIFFVSV